MMNCVGFKLKVYDITVCEAKIGSYETTIAIVYIYGFRFKNMYCL